MFRRTKMNTRIPLSPAFEAANERLKTNPKISADEFDLLLIESVEQTLTDLFGTKTREALLDYLARHDRLGRADIPGHPRELSRMLEENFGKSSISIEEYIMRRLYSLLELEYKETSDFNFANKVEEAKARIGKI